MALYLAGLTGELRFNNGQRSSLSLKLMKFHSQSGDVTRIGTWNTRTGISLDDVGLIVDNDTGREK